MHEYLLDLIVKLILKILKVKPGSEEKLADLFMDHLESHPQCVGSLIIFYKITFFSDIMTKYMRENNYSNILLNYVD